MKQIARAIFALLLTLTTVTSWATPTRYALTRPDVGKLTMSQLKSLKVMPSCGFTLKKQPTGKIEINDDGEFVFSNTSFNLNFSKEETWNVVDYDLINHILKVQVGNNVNVSNLFFKLDEDSTSPTYKIFVLAVTYDTVNNKLYTRYPSPKESCEVMTIQVVWLEYSVQEKSNFSWITSTLFDYHRGFVLGGGIGFGGSLPVKLEASWSPRIHSSIALEAVMYPFPSQQWLGVGCDFIYYYTAAWGVKSVFVYDGDGPTTVTDPKSVFRSRKIAFTPVVETDISLGKGYYLEPKLSCFVFGAWNFTPTGDIGMWRQYYDMSFSISKEW